MSRRRGKREPTRAQEPLGHLIRAALLCGAWSDLQQAASPLRYACERLGMCEHVCMRVSRNARRGNTSMEPTIAEFSSTPV